MLLIRRGVKHPKDTTEMLLGSWPYLYPATTGRSCDTNVCSLSVAFSKDATHNRVHNSTENELGLKINRR